jgi:hypothetical protein
MTARSPPQEISPTEICHPSPNDCNSTHTFASLLVPTHRTTLAKTFTASAWPRRPAWFVTFIICAVLSGCYYVSYNTKNIHNSITQLGFNPAMWPNGKALDYDYLTVSLSRDSRFDPWHGQFFSECFTFCAFLVLQ